MAAETTETSGHPPEVTRFTAVMRGKARDRRLRLILDRVEVPRGERWATVKYSWESEEKCDVPCIVKQIITATLAHGDWVDSIRLETLHPGDADAERWSCGTTVKIRVGRAIKLWYALKINILSALCVGAVLLLLMLAHILWHLLSGFQEHPSASV